MLCPAVRAGDLHFTHGTSLPCNAYNTRSQQVLDSLHSASAHVPDRYHEPSDLSILHRNLPAPDIKKLAIMWGQLDVPRTSFPATPQASPQASPHLS